ncbi:MAG: type V CRISPR-associated protein Cas12b [Deltaproteobacteria bacterium]|nr:type V CRISPR-associated protein Cas12b [Deltaproteobacteria bacterium]
MNQKKLSLIHESLDELNSCLLKTYIAHSQAASSVLDGVLTELGRLPASFVNEYSKGKRKAAMLFLFSSWIVSESITERTAKFVIAKGTDPPEERRKKVAEAFERILKDEGLSEEQIEEWRVTCRYTLSADINKASVLVNRKALAAEDAKKRGLACADAEGARYIIDAFYGSMYDLLKLYIPKEDKPVYTNENCSIDCTNLLSNRFGKGKGANFQKLHEIYTRIMLWSGTWLCSLQGTLGMSDEAPPGTPSLTGLLEFLFQSELLPFYWDTVPDLNKFLDFLGKKYHMSQTMTLLEELGKRGTDTPLDQVMIGRLGRAALMSSARCLNFESDKGPKEYLTLMMNDASEASGIPFEAEGPSREFYVSTMAEALQRFKSHMSWVARRERARQSQAAKGKELMKTVHPKTVIALNEFRAKQKIDSGAVEDCEISEAEIAGYKQLYELWAAKKCETETGRLKVLEEFWETIPCDQRGSISLFRHLCSSDELPGWPKEEFDPLTDATPEDLIAYVKARNDLSGATRRKIPMLQHIDPYLSPVPLRFGEGRMGVKQDAKTYPDGNFFQYLTLTLWNGTKFVNCLGYWDSKRINDALAFKSSAKGPEAPCQLHDLYTKLKHSPITIRPNKKAQSKLRVLGKGENIDSKSLERIQESMTWAIDFHIKIWPYGPFHRSTSTKNEEHNAKPIYQAVIPPKKNQSVMVDIGWDLSGIKILCLDLGRNNSLALSFMHPTTAEALEALCLQNEVPIPTPSDLWCHVPVTMRNDEVLVKKTLIFRRTGPDILDDGKANSTPWARIGEQYLPKLPGESAKDRRELSDDEIVALHNADVLLGIGEPYVKRLMSSGFGQGKCKGNQRERLNRILKNPSLKQAPPCPPAKGKNPSLKQAPPCPPAEEKDPSLASVSRTAIVAVNELVVTTTRVIGHFFNLSKIPLLLKDESPLQVAKGLQNWWDLLRYKDKDIVLDTAAKLWDCYIKPLPGYQDLFLAYSKRQLGKASGSKYLKFVQIAQSLMNTDLDKIARHFKEALEEIEANLVKVKYTAHSFLFPCRFGTVEDGLSARQMGGLSHLRIDAMNRLIYKVMKPLAFHRANKLAEGGVAKGSSGFDITEVGKIEKVIVQRLVAQRVDEIVSIVTTNALGTYWKNAKNGKSSTGPGSGDEKLCPIVVMENLDSLTPNLGRTMSENRLISTMRAGGIREKLKQRCRRLGLMLIEVDPAETAAVDSRTGAFGMRAREISAAKFMSQPGIRKKVEEARVRSEKGTALAEDWLWISIDDRLKSLSKSDLAKTANVFIPSKGGALFLSGDEKSSRIIHADINAACNIGLRALTTPSWVGGGSQIWVD